MTLISQLKHPRSERLERRECPALPDGPERTKRHRRTAAMAFAASLVVSLSIGAVSLYPAAICVRHETVCLCASWAEAATPGASTTSATADVAALGAPKTQPCPEWDVGDGNARAAFRLPAGDVELAEIIDCEILVLTPSGAEYRIELPRSEWLSSGIEIVGDGPTRVESGDGASAPDKWVLQLMPMETGELSVQGPVIVFESSAPSRSVGTSAAADSAAGADTLDEGSDSSSQKGILQLPGHTLEVVNPLDGLDEAELRPMKDPISAHPDYRRLVAALVALVAAIACVSLLATAIRRRLRRSDRRESVVPRRPAHEIAYERLGKIEEDRLIERGLHRQFHFAISECLREYLENRYGVPALEMTTEEFFEHTRTRPDLPDICRSGVVDLLNLSDLVKFAKRESMSGEMKQVLESVRRLVDDTREADEAQEADDKAEADASREGRVVAT